MEIDLRAFGGSALTSETAVPKGRDQAAIGEGVMRVIEYATNKRGLHARASAKFVTFVSRLPESVSVEVEKGGSRVNGTSIMGLMMLGAAMGDSITIHVSGGYAEDALEKLAELVGDRFGEE